MENTCDVLIIGGGPAGLTAGIYTGRAKLSTVVMEKMMPGGQIASTDLLENYPGFPDGISGWEIADAMRQQCEKWGARFTSGDVKSLRRGGAGFLAETTQGELEARTVIIAAGARPRPLNVPGEKEFTGRGVSWCATCDGAFYNGKKVAVIGGGNSAVEEGLFLTRFAAEVTFLQDLPELTATQVYVDKVMADPKCRVITNTKIEAIEGEQFVTGVSYSDRTSGAKSRLDVDGVFIYIGMLPNTDWLGTLLPLDKWGYIQTDPEMRTDIPGLFAAGDIRIKEIRQVATAVGDGTIAAIQAEKYLAALD